MNTTRLLSKKVAAINRALQHATDPAVRERLLMLKTYYRIGNLRDAARECRCSHGKVKYWKDRFESDGVRSLLTRIRPGRPTDVPKEKLTEIKRAVVRKSRKEGWSVKQLRAYVREESGRLYSLTHTVRIAASWGLAMITPRPRYVRQAPAAEQNAFFKGEHGILGALESERLYHSHARRGILPV